MIYLRQQWEHKQDQYQPHNGNTKQDSHMKSQIQMKMKNLMRNYGKIKVLKNITHHMKVKRHPHLQTQDEENEVSRPDIYVTRSGRRSKPPERLIYDANACLIRTNEHEDKETWIEQNLLAYKASTNPDTMYHYQAMKQPDREKFQEAMKKECEAHYKEGNYRLVKKSELPEGATLLSSVWQMKRK
jgi:hypothetical protein